MGFVVICMVTKKSSPNGTGFAGAPPGATDYASNACQAILKKNAKLMIQKRTNRKEERVGVDGVHRLWHSGVSLDLS